MWHIILCTLWFQKVSKLLQRQQNSLEQKEQLLTETGKRIDQAESQHKLLEVKLSELQNSSQLVAMEAAQLVKTREELEIELAAKKERKERLLAQKPFMTDTELFLQMMNEAQASIDEIKKQIALLQLKIKEQNAKEESLKEDITKKQKELENSDRYLQASRKKCSLLQSKLKAERMEFDLTLRQQLVSNEKLQEELKVAVN